MTKKGQTTIYFLSDLISLGLIWTLFYAFRDIYIENTSLVLDSNYYKGLVVIVSFWMLVYTMQGTYMNVLRHYRLKTILSTLLASIIGTLVIFIVLLLDDIQNLWSYKQYYQLLFGLFTIHFSLTIFPRLIITTLQVKKIHKGLFGFSTLIIGGSDKAVEILKDLKELKQSSGHIINGFVNINGADFKLKESTPLLGNFSDIKDVIKTYNIQEVIIALESSDHQKLNEIITKLSTFDIKINIVPDNFDILSGQVKMSSIFGALLIRVNKDAMPEWQFATKRLFDVLTSIIVLIVLSPIYLLLAFLIKSSSKGPTFFTQERIGLNGAPFNIIKYRTMFVGSEKDGPQLSSSNDNRITPIGKVLRKTRLDEFPQFFNVLKGDMSIVGPRPERQFYIDKISEKDPQYLYLHKVRPGITSWGQVKFGYAENVNEMVQRMKYDLLYIRNMSLVLDFKIMFYTVAIIVKAKGK
jgi:exopolysaccharide biosynthesis polyprenyl glycosylphosphotransferase